MEQSYREAAYSAAQQSVNQGPSSVGSGARESGEESVVTAGQYLDKALHLIGNKMRSAATAVRERVPREGVTKGALESASQALESAGDYMSREHLREKVREDLGSAIKRHPVRTLGGCFLVGLAMGGILRAANRLVRS
jgi:hypothetical protein